MQWGHSKELEEKIRQKKADIKAHAETKPQEKPNPKIDEGTKSAESTKLEQLDQDIKALTLQIEELQTEQIEISTSVEELQQVRQSIKSAVDALTELESKHENTLHKAGLAFSQIITLKADYTALDTVIQKMKDRLQQIKTLLVDTEGIATPDVSNTTFVQVREETKATSLVCKKAAFEAQKAEIIDRLGKPAREYQQYLTELMLWNDREKELRGEGQNPGPETLTGLEKELERINTDYREKLVITRAKREAISKEIFQKKHCLIQFYNEVKQPIDAEIGKCKAQLGEYDIAIETGLRFNQSFIDRFIEFIHQGASGSFYGQDEGRAMLRRFTESVHNWDDENQVFIALNDVVKALHSDHRENFSTDFSVRDIFKQMKGQKTPQELYDYLFGFDYLEPKYDLKVDGKDLSELSPGERGGLLLIFYLMLDQQSIPLVIDQPEDNLDNKSVYEILVTFIKHAKKRRQIILVTHNPNLAVVADAEQIIHVSIDKKDGKHDFSFFSGAIEEPLVNQAVVDILEGTMPAFDNRRLKYRNHD